MHADSLTLAVDLGGTRMRAALVASDGTIVHRHQQRTPRGSPCPDALESLVRHVRDHGSPGRAVVGVPGRVDYDSGRLEYAPNLPPGWAEAIFTAHLNAILGVPTSLANDADLATAGEARFGAGRGSSDVAYITISTGVGAGAVLGGRLVHGRRSIAEIGHTIIDLSALCTGRPATVEALGSGTAMARAAHEAGLTIEGAALLDRVKAGDSTARAVWDGVATAVAAAVANLAHLVTSEVIVVGGGVGRTGDVLLGPARAVIAEHGPAGADIDVAVAELGDDAGLVGAAAWASALNGEGPADG
jgi:glucokinase